LLSPEGSIASNAAGRINAIAPSTMFRCSKSAAMVTAEALDRSWTAADTRAGRFDGLRALSDQAQASWLGHAVVLSALEEVGAATFAPGFV
jgi:hypothetical protein